VTDLALDYDSHLAVYTYKQVFVEPRSASEVDSVLQKYADSIRAFSSSSNTSSAAGDPDKMSDDQQQRPWLGNCSGKKTSGELHYDPARKP
jgi:hypothetical protein